MSQVALKSLVVIHKHFDHSFLCSIWLVKLLLCFTRYSFVSIYHANTNSITYNARAFCPISYKNISIIVYYLRLITAHFLIKFIFFGSLQAGTRFFSSGKHLLKPRICGLPVTHLPCVFKLLLSCQYPNIHCIVTIVSIYTALLLL